MGRTDDSERTLEEDTLTRSELMKRARGARRDAHGLRGAHRFGALARSGAGSARSRRCGLPVPGRARPATSAPWDVWFGNESPRLHSFETRDDLADAIAAEAVRVAGSIEAGDRLRLAHGTTALELQRRRFPWSLDEVAARAAAHVATPEDGYPELWADTVHTATSAQRFPDYYQKYALVLYRGLIEQREVPVPAELQAVALGDQALIANPFEPFTDVGAAIAGRSPFAGTRVLGYTNGYAGYLPPPADYAKIDGYGLAEHPRSGSLALGLRDHDRLGRARGERRGDRCERRLPRAARLMRVGVLSDLHCELRPAGSRWLNPFATERLDEARRRRARMVRRRAGRSRARARGRSCRSLDLDDLEHVLSRLAAAAVAPVATVNGNHDLRLGAEFGARAPAGTGSACSTRSPLTIGGVDLAGVEIDRGPRLPQYVGRAGGSGEEGSILLVASHFPVLSEASRVAGGGIPYAGDIVNRAELEAGLRAAARPTVVLSGHIHVRCSTDDGTLLQFTVGALIESPFDATIVELDPAALEVRRTSRRLGEPAPFDPVLAADEERRRWDGRWLAVPAA